jgi:hypothetical protein
VSGVLYSFFCVFKSFVILEVFFKVVEATKLCYAISFQGIKRGNYERLRNLLNAFKQNAKIPTSHIEQFTHYYTNMN